MPALRPSGLSAGFNACHTTTTTEREIMATIHSFTLHGDDIDLVGSLLRAEYKRIRKESPDAFEQASAGSWVTRIEILCLSMGCVMPPYSDAEA
jgi:hypothetical protein